MTPRPAHPLHRMLPLLTLLFGLLSGTAFADARQVELYKSPACGCCIAHARYLEQHGFEVRMHDRTDLAAIKQEYGVPPAMQGCHTALIDGYVVEGHVPVEAIRKLLRERPDVTGIAVPGMPTGSPGMGGPRTEPLVTWTFGGDAPSVFLTQQ